VGVDDDYSWFNPAHLSRTGGSLASWPSGGQPGLACHSARGEPCLNRGGAMLAGAICTDPLPAGALSSCCFWGLLTWLLGTACHSRSSAPRDRKHELVECSYVCFTEGIHRTAPLQVCPGLPVSLRVVPAGVGGLSSACAWCTTFRNTERLFRNAVVRRAPPASAYRVKRCLGTTKSSLTRNQKIERRACCEFEAYHMMIHIRNICISQTCKRRSCRSK
jgi:hypothetical protein